MSRNLRRIRRFFSDTRKSLTKRLRFLCCIHTDNERDDLPNALTAEEVRRIMMQFHSDMCDKHLTNSRSTSLWSSLESLNDIAELQADVNGPSDHDSLSFIIPMELPLLDEMEFEKRAPEDYFDEADSDRDSSVFTISSLSDTESDIFSLPDLDDVHDSDADSGSFTTVTSLSSFTDLFDDADDTYSDISFLDGDSIYSNLSSSDDDYIVNSVAMTDRANESLPESHNDLSENQRFLQDIAHSLLDSLIAEVSLALAEKKKSVIAHKPPTGKTRIRKADRK